MNIFQICDQNSSVLFFLRHIRVRLDARVAEV